MARLLVLGARGFIGRAVRRELAIGGHLVVCLDRVPAPSTPGEEWVQLDLVEASSDEIRAVISRAGPDAIVNCAGLVDGSTEQLVRANVLLVARLLEVAHSERFRLVHLGSAAEYGVSEQGSSTDEDDALRPLTAYAVAKLGGTLLVANAVRSGDLEGVALRLFNPLGPGMPPGSMPGRAAALILAARASGSSSITMGPLDAWRDFIDVRDVAAAIAGAALAPSLDAPILNVGTGHSARAREVVRAIADAAGWQGEVIEEHSLASRRSAAVSWQQASTRRIEATLGWRPMHSIQDAAGSVLALEG